MNILLNGKEVELDSSVKTVEELVKHYDLKREHVVAEVDGTILDRNEWESYELVPNSKIELVHFVGGG